MADSKQNKAEYLKLKPLTLEMVEQAHSEIRIVNVPPPVPPVGPQSAVSLVNQNFIEEPDPVAALRTLFAAVRGMAEPRPRIYRVWFGEATCPITWSASTTRPSSKPGASCTTSPSTRLRKASSPRDG